MNCRNTRHYLMWQFVGCLQRDFDWFRCKQGFLIRKDWRGTRLDREGLPSSVTSIVCYLLWHFKTMASLEGVILGVYQVFALTWHPCNQPNRVLSCLTSFQDPYESHHCNLMLWCPHVIITKWFTVAASQLLILHRTIWKILTSSSAISPTLTFHRSSAPKAIAASSSPTALLSLFSSFPTSFEHRTTI